MALIQDFWQIDYTNKRIYYDNQDPSFGADTVYSVNDLYSYLQDVFDDLDQMDDYVPMSAQTPTAYTLINGWFIDDDSIKYLDGGAITQDNANNDISMVQLGSGGNWNNFESTDIGLAVTGSVSNDTGILLAYNNTTYKVWIRLDNTANKFDSGDIILLDSGGVGSGDASANGAVGTDLFTNVYTLGTITDNPYAQVYIFQDGESIAEWSDLTNWDRGHIDILVKVKESGTEFDDGIITVFARQFSDLYDNFEIDLSAGGRNAVPLASSTDLDNATPSHYLIYESKSGALTINEILTGGTSGATAELRMTTDDITNYATDAAGTIFLGGIKGTFVDGETITGGSSGETLSVDGTIGDTFITYGVTFSTEPNDDDIGTVITGADSNSERILKGWYHKGAAGGHLVALVDSSKTGTDRIVYHEDFTSGEVVTSAHASPMNVTIDAASQAGVASLSDITITFVNGTADYDTKVGTFIKSERITWGVNGNAIVLLDDTPGTAAGSMTLGNVVDPDTEITGGTNTFTGDTSGATAEWNSTLSSAHTMQKTFEGVTDNNNYDVIVECGQLYTTSQTGEGRNIANVYEYLKYITTEDSTHQMYTVVSSVITPLDGEEYILAYTGYSPVKAAPFGTFAGGTLFGSQGIWIENMHSDDTQSISLVDSDGDIQTPPNYQAIVVNNLEHNDTVSVFESDGSGNTDVKKNQYTCTAQGAASGTIVIGETIPTSTPTTGFIRVVDTSEEVEYRYAYSSWSSSTFTLDGVTTDVALTTSDTAYVPFVDLTVGAVTSTSKTVIYTADIYLVCRVRQKGFLPFQTTGTYSSIGSITGAIRTTDGIVT